MEPVYIIFIGLVLLPLWGFIISYREDHPKKPLSDKNQSREGKLMPKTKTVALENLEQKSLSEVLLTVVNNQEILIIKMPDGQEVVIQPKQKLKPLPLFEGYVPKGWKVSIYSEPE